MTWELREEARRREREKERLDRAREELARDLRAVAATTSGRRLLRWLLERGRLFQIDYQPGNAGAYRAGEKAQALRLWHLLRESLSASAFAGIALFERGDDEAAEAVEVDRFHTDQNGGI